VLILTLQGRRYSDRSKRIWRKFSRFFHTKGLLLWQLLGMGAPTFKTVKRSQTVFAQTYGPQHEWVKLAADGYRNVNIQSPMSV
jgi:hypothetical protein